MTKKQETLFASFGRQRKPSVHRPKDAMSNVSNSQPFVANDHDDNDDNEGMDTDVDAFSSQETSFFYSQQKFDDSQKDFISQDSTSSDLIASKKRKTSHELLPPVDQHLSGLELSQKLHTPQTSTVPLHKRKVVKDSVHGCIYFEPLCMRIIDTLQFQRLRNLHQLGAANFVYIGATHSRFEHCLGVAFLAERLISTLKTHQPWLPITEKDILCVKIAGLCHDLGHGPFSHVFDGIFMHQLRRKKLIIEDKKWTHEQGSIDMLVFLLKSNNICLEDYGLDEKKDLIFIQELIYGGPLSDSSQLQGRPFLNQRFLYEIVNNARNGLDVDKLDYFMRDAAHTGAKPCCDTQLIIDSARVLIDRNDPEQKPTICFPEKLAGQVMQVYATRFALHQTVYQHKAIRAIEYMICDVLLAAKDHLFIKKKRICDVHQSLEAYQHVDDRILGQIQASNDPNLSKARDILMRIYTKPLYECIGKTKVTLHSKHKTEEMLVDEILCCSSSRSLQFKKDQVILEFIKVHYGQKEKDPLLNVRFYSKHAQAQDQCFQLPREAYEMHCPQHFMDHSIRVYVKEKEMAPLVRQAFHLWGSKYNQSMVFPIFNEDEEQQ